VIYSASVVAFFVFSRYRLHVVPALAVLAASSLPWLGEQIRLRRVRPLVAAGVAAVVIAAFSFQASGTFGMERRENPQGAINLAWLYRQRGDHAPAEKLLLETLERQEGGARAGPLCALGDLHLEKGEVQRAVSALEACALANPAYPEAWLRLGLAYERAARIDDALAALDVQLRAVPGHAAARAHLERLRQRGAQ
jgi:tetratricopeptide (TPR) repeat protein